VVLAALSGILAACDHGCGWLGGVVGGAGPSATGSLPAPAVDCPDGLARCEDGTVSASRLATLRVPCVGPASACTCPWEAVATCPDGCVADGVEVVIERDRAAGQLCAPGRDAGVLAASPLPTGDAGVLAASPLPTGDAVVLAASPLPGVDAGETVCEEGDRFRCAGGRVVECASAATAGLCLRGCFAEGMSIDDDGVSREAAFAILCSR
jgi:hypothetical protein